MPHRHKKLLEILELIKEKDIAYEDIYVGTYGKVLTSGTRLAELNLKTFNSAYGYGFTIAIIQKEHEDIASVLGREWEVHSHKPRRDLLHAVVDYHINYINIQG